MVYNEKPDISNLVPFFSEGYYHKTKDERNSNLSFKSESCRMIGYKDKN